MRIEIMKSSYMEFIIGGRKVNHPITEFDYEATRTPMYANAVQEASGEGPIFWKEKQTIRVTVTREGRSITYDEGALFWASAKLFISTPDQAFVFEFKPDGTITKIMEDNA